MLISSLGTALTAIALGFGLNAHQRAVSGASIISFVLFFSIGLAPIPWVVLSEVVPLEARTAVGAVAVSVNWLTNFAAVRTLGAPLYLGDHGVLLISRARCSCLCNKC